MSSITVRNIDPELKQRLRVRAAARGHSMEAEVREILETALPDPTRPSGLDLYNRIRARLEPFGEIELDIPLRVEDREPPRFE